MSHPHSWRRMMEDEDSGHWPSALRFECNQDSSAIRFSQRQRMNVKIGPLSYHDLQTNRTNLHMKHQTNPLISDSTNQLISPIHSFSAKRVYFAQSLAARPSRPCSLASSAAFLPWHLRTKKPLKPPDQLLNLQKDTEI